MSDFVTSGCACSACSWSDHRLGTGGFEVTTGGIVIKRIRRTAEYRCESTTRAASAPKMIIKERTCLS